MGDSPALSLGRGWVPWGGLGSKTLDGVGEDGGIFH